MIDSMVKSHDATIRRVMGQLMLAAALTLTLTPAASGAKAQEDSLAVQPADTLLGLSLFYGVPPAELAEASGVMSMNLIGAGDALTVPVGASQIELGIGGPVEPPTQTAPEDGTPANPDIYVIQPGDTLFRIATRFGVSMRALAYVNDIVYPDTIYVGQQLTIPDGSEAIPDEQALEPLPTPDEPEPLAETGGPPGGWAEEGKHIVVVLSEQMTYAYEDGNLLGQFLSSTGLPATPTVVGDYAIYLKFDSQRMVGPDYDLPGVPWVMYFYQGYGLHGTYWHNNFGQPMSHGCVNLRTGDAAWLYSWAPLGTPVHVIW